MTGFLPRRSRARRRDDAPRIFTALLLRKWPRLVHGAAHDSLPYREYCISGAVAIIVAHRQLVLGSNLNHVFTLKTSLSGIQLN